MIGASPIGVFPIGGPESGAASVNRGFATITLPALTGVLAASAPASGGLSITLPPLTAVMQAQALERAIIAADLPALTAYIYAVAPVNGHMAPILPALTAEMEGVTGSRRSAYSFVQCPRPASGFTPSGRIGTRRGGSQ